MKKIIYLFLAGLIFTQPIFAADQWDESKPAGTEASGTIDNLLRVNNEALDRLVINYKRGLGVNYATAATLSVLQGEIAIPNGAGTTIKWRRTTGATSITWSDIDTGAEASSTQYYLYATADTDITGMVFKISASSSAPSGMTYYRKIASFYNDSTSTITNVLSLRGEDGTDYPDVVKGWIVFNAVTATITDSYNVSSLTDNGTGDFTISWETDFASANYAVSGTSSSIIGGLRVIGITTLAASSARINIQASDDTKYDESVVTLMAIGDRV